MSTFLRYPYGNPVEVGRNLITNPNFEVSLANYNSTIGSPALAHSNSTAYNGTYSMRMTVGTSGTNEASITYSATAVTASTEYTFTFYMRHGTGTSAKSVAAAIRFNDGAGTPISAVVTGTTVASSTTWQRVSVTATAPVGAVYCTPVFRVLAAAVADVFYFDAVMLNTGPTGILPWFDGSYGLMGEDSFRWLGTPNNSVSVWETPGVLDRLTPTLSIASPWVVTKETRTIARTLLESATVRTVLIDSGPRQGTMTTVYDTPLAGMNALAFFSGRRVYRVTDEVYATFWFVVTGGELQFETNGTPGIVTVPFVEVDEP